MVIVKEEMVDVGLHSIEIVSGTVRFGLIWFGNLTESNSHTNFWVRFCSITEPNRTYSFD